MILCGDRVRVTLHGYGVEERCSNALAWFLESCYQVLHFPKVSFLHTGSSLEERDREGEEERKGGREREMGR